LNPSTARHGTHSMSLVNRLIANVLPAVPRPIIGQFSRRYIAGATLDDAVRVVRDLNRAGVMATIDVLGEHLVQIEESKTALAAYLEVLDRISNEGLDSNISVKLTALGLKVDPGMCLTHMQRLCAAARERRNFVRIDMEDSSCTSATFAIYRQLRQEFDCVGAVIQAYLRRSRGDATALAAEGANLRVCKGIYIEPRTIAYQDRDIVRENFAELISILLGKGCYVGIATHDELVVWNALRLIDELGLKPEAYEFQMLLGVDEELRRILIDAGHRLRVYVPFGAHWYAYSIRRLKENPNIVGHILHNAVRSTTGRGRR
jgi:proline dehydrogenase